MEFTYHAYLKKKGDTEYKRSGLEIKINKPLQVGTVISLNHFYKIGKIEKIEEFFNETRVYLTC